VLIANAFHRAEKYDRHAAVQREVADQLAAHILALELPSDARVLEIGCGTGFLGAGLVGHLPFTHYRMTDIAPGMLDRARQRFAETDDIVFAEMDAANPTIDGPFDLICSSLAMQWVADLPGAVARLRGLLSPRGRLIFTTLGAGSFAEWRAAYGDATPGTPDYPEADVLRTYGLDVSVDTIERSYAGARDFLAALKAIGANTPQPGYRPLSPTQLRDVMARFEADGATARYAVATCSAGPLP
jgi:malonyl-CoA O-methyltransferase